MKLTKWTDLKRRKLTPEQVDEAERWARLENLAMDLRQLREWAGMTQAELAERVELSQAELSRAERRDDHLLSTLRRYIEGLGGKVEVLATINDKSIRLKV